MKKGRRQGKKGAVATTNNNAKDFLKKGHTPTHTHERPQKIKFVVPA